MRSFLGAARGPFAIIFGVVVAGGVLVAVAPAAQAATFTVTNTDDSGAGSLRQAIIDANASAGADTIDFAIPGPAPHTIQLTSAVNLTQALPPITEAVTIDGTTQLGYAGTPVIEVLEQAPPSARTALTVSASAVGIYGLSLTGFGTGVYLTSTSSDSEVGDNFFGINLAGTAVQGQQLNVGVRVEGGDDNWVVDNHISNAGTGIWVYGSASAGSPRFISGNRIGIGTSNMNPLPVNEGILLDTSANSVDVAGNSVVGHPGNSFGIRLVQTGGLVSVTGNRIGFGADDFPSFPGRVGGGIVLNGATSSPTINNNQIFGGSGTGLVVHALTNPMAGGASGNVISGNGGAGISVSGGGLARFQIGGNQISSNDGLGIDVAPAGVNSVPDGGPTIDSITPGPSGTNSITMTYAGPTASAGASMNIFLNRNSECDPSGFGEGEGLLGSGFTTRVLDANGDFFTTFSVDDDIAPGDLITAMLSSGDVPSTEFSNCYTVPSGPTNATPTAGAQGPASVPAGLAFDLLLSGTDADDDDLTFDVDTPPTNGDLSAITGVDCTAANTCAADVTYTPDLGFTGADSFTFTVNDGQSTSAPATVSLNVLPPANTAPEAQPGSFPVVSDGSPAGRILYATDADEDLLTFSITRQPDSGSVSGPDAVSCAPNADFGDAWTCQQTWGYLATPGFSGVDSFEFEACDPSNECSTATVDVTVTAPAVEADLSMVTLSDTPDPVTAGGVVAYQATMKNLGPATATGVTVEFADPGTESLPAGVSFDSGTVSSSAGGSGSCSLPEEGSPVTCILGNGSVPASGSTTWTVTAYLRTSASTPATIDLRARVQGDQSDPTADNSLTESTMVEPFGEDETTVYVPPSSQTETIATAETILVGGEEIPIAQPGDTTAAAAAVPPGGPGGVVSVAELACEPPFCATAARTTVPTPVTPPIDDRVIQFIPPFAPYYDYRHPVTYSIVYDATVVSGVNARNITALYTKEDDPGTGADESQVLYQAVKCPKRLTAVTEFPCLQSAKVLKGKNQLLKGDLQLRLLGTYNDPKIAGFR